MSRYGSPILETPDIIGNFNQLYQRALQDQQAKAQQDRAFAYRQQQDAYSQQQDAAAFDQDRIDAGAMNTAMGGGYEGVSRPGLEALDRIQRQHSIDRDNQFETEMKYLGEYARKGSRMAAKNAEMKVQKRYPDVDWNGYGDALLNGDEQDFTRRKLWERDAMLADQQAKFEQMQMQQRPGAIAAAQFMGMDTAGADGTMGPSATPEVDAFVNMDPATRGKVISDKMMEDRAIAAAQRRTEEAQRKEAAKQITPEQREQGIQNIMLDSKGRTSYEDAAADFDRLTGYGQGVRTKAMRGDSGADPAAKAVAKQAEDEAKRLEASIRASLKAEPGTTIIDHFGSQIPLGYARRRIAELRAEARASLSGGGEPSAGDPAGSSEVPPDDAISAAWDELGPDADPAEVVARARELAGGG